MDPTMEKPEHSVHDEKTLDNEEKNSVRNFDLGEIVNVESTPEEDRKVLRKLDLFLIPLMGAAYFLQFLDKYILGQAAIFGLREELHLHGGEFAWTSAIFYFGYLAWSWPSSYVIVRVWIGKYLGLCVIIWGGILMCHAACKNFSGLMAARFFLGLGEAAIAPGFSLITGMYWKREEQPLRQSAWFFGNCLAALFGGLVSYGIGHIDSHIASWKLIFIILGAVTSGYGIVLTAFLPDSPAKALFLRKKERAIAVKRTLENKTGVMDMGSFKWHQARQAILDPQTWFLFLATISSNLANGGLTTFAAIITKGFGFSNFKALLLQMPIGAVEILSILIVSPIASFVPSARLLCMIFTTIVSMVGMLLVWKLDEDNVSGRVIGLALSVAYVANIPLSLSVITSNVAGYTKKSVTSASLFVGYCVGNIVGPQFFYSSEAPSYPTGLTACISGYAFAAFFFVCLYIYYRFENQRRDRRYGTPEEATVSQELQDELSNKSDWEIESFRYVL